MSSNLAVIVLAAGKGKRMKSALPKVLHPLLGEPQVNYVIKAVSALKPKLLLVVVGKKFDELREVLPEGVKLVIQPQPLGTGNAVSCCLPELVDFSGEVMVVNGDTPLIRSETLISLFDTHLKQGNEATLLTAFPPDSTGYGRIIRKGGQVVKIVEEKDALPEEKKISEVNTGFYIFRKRALFNYLNRIKKTNQAGEYYLTDLIGLLVADGFKVGALVAEDWRETANVNSRRDLIEAQKIIQERINFFWLDNGVTIVNPDLTYIGPEVKLARDVTILPLSFLKGKTRVGEGSVIGPSVELKDCQIGKRVCISYSWGEDAVIKDEAQVGPFARLRGGTFIGKKARVGTFVEIKKSKIGKESKVPHLSYLGDATVGDKVNIGAGTITCNFDGKEKHPTFIEDEAFVGSDTMLIAPIKIGKGSITGAGSVLTRDVPAGSLAIERSEQKIIKDWAKRRKRDSKKGGD